MKARGTWSEVGRSLCGMLGFLFLTLSPSKADGISFQLRPDIGNTQSTSWHSNRFFHRERHNQLDSGFVQCAIGDRFSGIHSFN
jgi:hypothetical protein